MLKDDLETNNVSNTVSAGIASRPLIGTFTLTPVWDAVPVEKGQGFPLPTCKVVIVGGIKDNQNAIKREYPHARVLDIQSNDTVNGIVKKLTAHGPIDHILWIAPHHSLISLADNTIIQEQNHGVILVFRMIKSLLHLGYGTRELKNYIP
jgi:hypothetical protein